VLWYSIVKVRNLGLECLTKLLDGAPADERAAQRLNGQVAGPLACTLYVYADPAGAIAETTRANNLAGIDYRGLCQRIYLPLILRNR